jgi:hypothetical protein
MRGLFVSGRKALLRVTALLTFALFTSGCDAFRTLFDEPTKPGSKGAAYELIVVCAQDLWDGEVGDTLRSVLLRPVEMLNQREPYFDVLRVTPDGFLKLNTMHRNVLVVNVNPTKYDSARLVVTQDVYALNQLLLSATAPTAGEMVSLLDTERENILGAYELVEQRRNTAAYEKYGPKHISNLVTEKFGFTMLFPAGFKLAKQTDDFIWTRYEMPKSGQGVLVYSYPYNGPEDLSERSIVAKRNKYAALVPGPADGSYMTTVEAIVDDTGENYVPFMPKYRSFSIEDCPWIELSGFWEVEGDFMGGPFVSYTTVNKATKEVVTYDCYLYSPRDEKRNMLRELQHFIYLMKFPKAE